MPTTKEGSGQPTVLYSVRQEFSQIFGYFSGQQTANNIHNQNKYIHNYT